MPPPASGAAAVCFLISLTATVALASAITMLMHVALIWTLSGRGFNTVMTGVVIVFSGLVIPLPLFPDWLQTAAVLATVSRTRRRAVSNLRRQHRAARGGVRIVQQIVWTALIIASGYAS